MLSFTFTSIGQVVQFGNFVFLDGFAGSRGDQQKILESILASIGCVHRYRIQDLPQVRFISHLF